jgi:hypothetical protein
VVSPRPLITDVRVRARVNPCGICGAQKRTGHWNSNNIIIQCNVFMLIHNATVVCIALIRTETTWKARNATVWALLLRTREFPSSNFGVEAGYPDWKILWFSSVPPGECHNSTLKWGHDRFLPNHFHFIFRVASVHSTKKGSLNKLQVN